MRCSLGALVAAAALAVAGCGGGGKSTPTGSGPTTVQSTKVEVVKGSGDGGSFDPAAIYKRTAPGVVTVISVFRAGGLSDLLGGGSENQAGLGSG